MSDLKRQNTKWQDESKKQHHQDPAAVQERSQNQDLAGCDDDSLELILSYRSFPARSVSQNSDRVITPYYNLYPSEGSSQSQTKFLAQSRAEKQLASFLRLSPTELSSLSELDLSCCMIGTINKDRLHDLCAAIKQCSGVLKIELQGNWLDELNKDEIHDLFAAFSMCSMQELNLSENYFDKLDLHMLHELFVGLAKCRSLHKLDLSRNGLHVLEGELFEHLRKVLCEDLTNLQELNLQCEWTLGKTATEAQKQQWLRIKETVNQRRIESNRAEVSKFRAVAVALCRQYYHAHPKSTSTTTALPKALVEKILVQADLAEVQDGKVRIGRIVPFKLKIG